ncbi:MAG: hypothetical protein RJB66_2735 [Pseudomonadota bacterium]|jgi:hypothetical protein
MKNTLLSKIVVSFFAAALLTSPMTAFAHDPVNFEYICSVTQKNKDGQFRDVINVVFLPDWQKKSHLWADSTKDIWFEIMPVHNGMGEVEGYTMELRLFLNKSESPTLSFHGPEFSEIGFENFEQNIGAHCFHRSQRGKN